MAFHVNTIDPSAENPAASAILAEIERSDTVARDARAHAARKREEASASDGYAQVHDARVVKLRDALERLTGDRLWKEPK